MRRPLWNTVIFVAVLALLTAGPVACSDDDTGGSDSQDTGTTVDASDSGEDAGSDAADADNDTGQDAGDTGSDAADASDAADTSDTADAADTTDTAPVDPETGHSGCTHPADPDATCDPEDYGDHGPGSFLNQFTIEGGGDCCRDFDNDGTVDSALGDLISALESSGLMGVSDFNEEVIKPQIENGTIVFLFEYAYWSDPVDDAALDFNLLFGQDSDTDFAPNLAGTGDFLVDPASLDSNGEYESDFPTASVSNAHLSVPSGTAPLVLPVGADLVKTNVEDLQVEADVVGGTADLYTSGRVELTGGEISGIVTLEEMFASLNTVAAACGCFTTAPVYVESSPDNWTCEATSADQNACAGVSTMCETLSTPSGSTAITCGTVSSIISNYADVNLDDDNAKEALSLGARFEAVGAAIVGVATTP